MARVNSKKLMGALISGHLEDCLSGKLGDKVYVKRKGKPSYVRSLPHKSEDAQPSEKQLANRVRFTAVTRYAQACKESLIVPIWNKSAHGTLSGYNLFVKANSPAFNTLGELSEPLKLRFSTGRLTLPAELSATLNPDRPEEIQVKWVHSPTDHVHAKDRLQAVAFGQGKCLMTDTGILRSETKASITLPLMGEERFLALFFYNEKRDIYSDDRIFTL